MGKRVAFLVADGFERSELEVPYNSLSNAGMEVFIVSPNYDTVRSWRSGNWSADFKVDVDLKEAHANHYDALVLPGGVINPDILRRDSRAVRFVRDFFEGEEEKPVGAICHGPWMLVEADVVKNRKLTSFSSIHTDIVNAEGIWLNSEVVVDGALVTSRSPADLPAFISKLKEAIEAGPVEKSTRAEWVDHYQSPQI